MEKFHPSVLPETRHFFFTGKGGVGKTSTACATAVALADRGKKVLIVSTDPASNLQDVFKQPLSNEPVAIHNVSNLFAANLDPEESARNYREKLIGPYRKLLPKAAITSMEEQLSGACTVEIAAFDEFTNLLTNKELTSSFDHIIFDTAPTGHTLRLLQLPSAWTDFLEDNTSGASCLGPLAGLTEKKELYSNTVKALSDRSKTTLLLITRPEQSSIKEAERASLELKDLGMTNQVMILNGLFQPIDLSDPIATALVTRQQLALTQITADFKKVTSFYLPLVSFNLTGIDALRSFFNSKNDPALTVTGEKTTLEIPSLSNMIDEFSKKSNGVIMTMGKGGVGKTTIAVSIAIALAQRGLNVHLTTTDPAAHITNVIHSHDKLAKNLLVSRIDPKEEVEKYKEEIVTKLSSTLDEDSLEFMKEELHSPCTEEIAVFRAFADMIEKSTDSFVVIDTAPTGHTLLLLDAAQSYHKEVSRSKSDIPESVKKLLPRLRDPHTTNVVLVTLPEATPVYEAMRLQEDLNRAEIHPKWWVINQSFFVTDCKDPILLGRAHAEQQWIAKVRNELADNCIIIPWEKEEINSIEKVNDLLKK